MTELEKPTGYLRDPEDSRDRMFGAEPSGELVRMGIDLAPAIHLPRHKFPPLYQKGSSCTGRIAHAFRVGWFMHSGRDPGELSGLDNYWKSRFLAGLLDKDGGSYIRVAVQAGIKYGFAEASDWPEVRENIQREVPPAVQRRAQKFDGVRAYFRLNPKDPEEVKRVLAADYAIMAGFQVAPSFLRDSGPPVVSADELDDAGPGHALVLDGYGPSGVHSPASWHGWRGTPYAEAGCWFTWEAIARAFDVWAVITGASAP